MTVDTHPADHEMALQEDRTRNTATDGPFARIVAMSLAAGLATALTLSLVVLAGHTEATITGALLVGFALGWALLGLLSRLFTDRPQGWTAVPASVMGATGLGLLVLTPQGA